MREAVRRARVECLVAADRVGMSRRRFLRSLCAASITLLALDACAREASADVREHHRAEVATSV